MGSSGTTDEEKIVREAEFLGKDQGRVPSLLTLGQQTLAFNLMTIGWVFSEGATMDATGYTEEILGFEKSRDEGKELGEVGLDEVMGSRGVVEGVGLDEVSGPMEICKGEAGKNVETKCSDGLVVAKSGLEEVYGETKWAKGGRMGAECGAREPKTTISQEWA